MSSWAAFQRRYEKLTAELRKETTESQRRQQQQQQVTTVVDNCETTITSTPTIRDHSIPLTPSPSPSDIVIVTTSTGTTGSYAPHVTPIPDLHSSAREIRTETSSTTSSSVSASASESQSNSLLLSCNHRNGNSNPHNNNNSCSSGSSPSPGSLLTPPNATAGKSISKSPSPSCDSSSLTSNNSNSSSNNNNNSSYTSSSFSSFSRSFNPFGRYSLGKAGVGFRTPFLSQFLANLSLGSNSNSTDRVEGERRSSVSSNTSTSNLQVSATEVVKTAETVNRIMDTQCLSPRPLRPRPRELLVSPNGGSAFGNSRSSIRSRHGDLSFLNSRPGVNPSHHRRSPNHSDHRDDSIRLSNKFPSNNTLTIDGQEYSISEQDFEYVEVLGAGSSGTVDKMRHKPTGRIIAVKKMRRSGNDDDTKRISNDLDILLKCSNCEHVVQCFGFMIKDVDVWICMELMASCFEKLLKQGILIPEEILGKVAVATVKALNYLKEHHKVMHRDVKPSNILINSAGSIKLCDFGISGRLVDSKAKTRQAGCTAYLAPERIQPEDPTAPGYDVRADVWSLGITLVELALQKFPYVANSDFEVLSKIMNDPPPSLPRDRFSPKFCDFIELCLLKDVKLRPKYKKLMEHPFVKEYESKPVDVASWFRNTGLQ